MLAILAIILILGWALGLFAFNVAGGLIHLVLVVAAVLFILHILNGRRA